MAKTLTDYLGSNASLTGTVVTIDLADLYASLFPGAASPITAFNDDDEVVATLVAGLHKRTEPAEDAEGNEIVDKDTSLVAAESFSPKTFEVRQEVSQVRHEFIFYVYTEDNTAFDPQDAV